ncbi:sulfatase-like hydrolase/transferase [Paenibacillus allorhizosphaerae]|nr:sulfatase-like hydrolase/transferase [Paenibacillus allorhizosphaerae]
MDRLNVLFLFADQMHAFALGCMGNEEIHTPHLDKLAADGVLFRNTYSNIPICTPYRGVLFSGKYACQTGIYGNTDALPADGKCLADRLNEGGVRTSYVGKWHLGGKGNIGVPAELRGGFQDFIGYQCYNDFLKQVWFFDENGNREEFNKHRSETTADIAMERLEQIKDEPFAMFVSFQDPHYPLQPSKPFDRMYRGKRLTRRPNAVDIDPYTKTESPPTPNYELDPNYLRYGDDLDEYLRMYYAMVSQLDYNVGRIVDKLIETGLYDNTVIIFTSDHGDMQGSHGVKNKQLFWEESTRVPLIVRVPKGARGEVFDECISTVDFYPSIMEYCGLMPADDVEGSNFVPMTLGLEQDWKKQVFAENKGRPMSPYNWFMVREGKYKLVVEQTAFQPTHLYDLEQDPYELVNLVDVLPHITSQYRSVIMNWHQEMMARADHATEGAV